MLASRRLAATRFANDHPFGLVFGAFLLLYIATGSGYVALSDGASMLAVSQSLIRGHLDVACSAGVPGVGGRCYSIYGLGWSIVVLPAYVLGTVVEHGLHLTYTYSVPAFAVSFVNPVLMAATVYVLAKFVHSLSTSVVKALATATIFGLASPAWVFTKDGFSEPLVMLLLISSAYLLRHGRVPSRRQLAVAGSLLAFAILTRLDAAPEVVAVCTYGLWPEDRRRSSKHALALIAPLFLVGAIQLAYDLTRFGAAWRTGYEAYGGGLVFHRTLAGFLAGLAGPLADPTRGLIWFVPAFLASILVFPRFARLAPAEATLCLSLFVIAWAEHANIVISWKGGWSWGPRYLMPVLPFLLLPLSALPARRSWTRLVAVLGCAGFLVNLAPVLVSYSRYFYAEAAGASPGRWPQIYLWQSALAAVRNALSRNIPNGRITDLATGGPGSILNGSTSLNSPDFWWFYLVHAHVHTRLVVLTLAIVVASLLLTIWTMVRAVARHTSENANMNASRWAVAVS